MSCPKCAGFLVVDRWDSDGRMVCLNCGQGVGGSLPEQPIQPRVGRGGVTGERGRQLSLDMGD